MLEVKEKKLFPRYKEYKDSGIDWLGEIPNDWITKRLKYLFKNHFGGVWGEEENGDLNDLVCIRVADFEFDRLKISDLDLTIRNISPNQQNRILDNRCILLEKSGGGEKQLVGRAVKNTLKQKSVCSNFIEAMTLNENQDLKFVIFLMASLYFSNVNYRSIKQTTGIQNLDIYQYLNEAVPFLALKEQENISFFLNEETEKLDKLIEKKQILIDLLKEKRTAIISQAVTKGLNLNVRMKDSDIPWLGQIPEHWEIKPLFTLFEENKERNSDNMETNLLSLSYGKIIRKNIETNFGLLPESFDTYQIVHPGYIVMRLTDLQNDHKSLRCGLVKEKGIITSAYVGLRRKKDMNESFAYNLLHTYDILKVFYDMGAGVRQTMKFSDLKWIPLPCAPKEEQFEIANYISKKSELIDNLVIQLVKQIEKIKEYRTALISAAITGKIRINDEI